MDDSLLVSILKMKRIAGIIFKKASLYPADLCLQMHSILFPWLLQEYLFGWTLAGDHEGDRVYRQR